VRALDGFSERVMQDTGGDKTAGQQLAKEALKIERQQLEVGKDQGAIRDQSKTQFQDQTKTQLQEQTREQLRTEELRVVADRARLDGTGGRRAAPTEWKKSNDGQVADTSQVRKVGEVNDARRTAELGDKVGKTGSGNSESNEARRTAELRQTETNETRRTAERNETRRTEMNETRRTTERNEARRTELSESRRTAERTEAQKADVRRTAERADARKASEVETRRSAEAKEFRRVAEVKEARRTAESKRSEAKADSGDRKSGPGLLDGRKWQKDGSGNFVAKDSSGRLITHDANGKVVDYQSHVNQKHMANQDQMAFASILFCNPLMMFGMGATLALMDQSHASKTAKLVDGLGSKFDGKQANKAANQTGYAGDMTRKAALIAQYTRPTDLREMSQMNGLAGMKGAGSTEREEMRKHEIKRQKSLGENAKQPMAKASMSTDRYSMSAKKLMKTKRLIEEEIERVRGKATLEEVSRLHSQVEVLERALKRMENF